MPQREAVRFALAARDVALIHGPPGTGKTTAVVELIRRAVRRGEKVLACAPSNLAVDNIFERLLAAGERAVRLGHPARVMADLRAHTLDLLVEEHPDVRLARKLVKEAMGLFRRADRYTRAKPLPGARQETRQEAKSLLADARRLEAQAVEHILDTADVLCATTTGLDSELLGTRRFDLGVIDEACQSTEPGCWVPLQWCNRVVLAGDHCQLPPTVVSPEAAAEGFGVSLFERLMAAQGPSIARPLTVQYRMHQAIMDFPSREFYEAELAGRCHRCADTCWPTCRASSPRLHAVAGRVHRHGRSELRRGGRARRREPPESAGSGPRVPQGPGTTGLRRGGRRHRRHRPLRRPSAAAARAVARAGPGDRQRRWLPGAGEGGRGDFARALQPAGRDRFPGGCASDERGDDAGPAGNC